MLQAGTRVGPYEVISWLGAGGMGEVYRARDTTLGREVALKTLPVELAGQPERLARLKQEARILASLNHSGIATVHGLEQSDGGLPVLVMELVEGESLADRLRRGPLPLREAVTVAHQIALALEAAHDKGVLHRDLKPGNVRVAPDGRVKLLDFGLAKVIRKAAVDSQLATDASPGSEAGAVLGTAPYMSPEQAKGQEADRRGDIWAFGCVLYEMLAGKRAFAGATFSETVAAVLDREPDWKALPPETPPALVRLLRRCLQKEKDQRLHDIADARLELEDVGKAPGPTTDASRERRRRAVWPVIALVAALVGALVSWALHRPPSVPTKASRFTMEASASVDPSTRQQALLLSPTGDRIVYDSREGLVVRELDHSEGHVIPGTRGVQWPFFSPDGKWLGFRDPVDFNLKKVSLTGGAPLFLCKGATDSLGATWGADDRIVFTRAGLWQVPASGGEPRELTKPDHARGEKTHRWPHYLPGGKAVLFTVGTSRLTRWDDARIDVLVLRTGERRTVLEGGTAAVYAESGHLVYQRGSSIFAVPFDLDHLATTGTPVAVVDGVQSGSSVQGGRSFTLARTGMLAYVPHTKNAERIVRVNRAGEVQPLTPWTGGVRWPRVSPDGRVVAAMIDGPNEQVWRFDIERETFSQVTFEWDNQFPVWSPDGEFLIISSGPRGQLRRVRADGGGRPEPILAGQGFDRIAGSMSDDGKLLAYSELGTSTMDDIWVVTLDGNEGPRLFVQTPATDDMPAISPDGRFLAYESDESGRFEIYLRSLPNGGHKVQVSAAGGFLPVWARNGKELFYLAPIEGSRSRMMVADVSQEGPLRIARGRGLFDVPYARAYDVFPDGQHFAMLEIDQETSRVTHFNVILNWFEELRRLVPAG